MKRSMFQLVLIAVLVAAFAVGSLAGCEFKSASKAAIDEQTALKATIKGLEERVADLEEENKQLTEELYAPLPLDEAVALYDGMIAANKGLDYQEWKYNLSDRLTPALMDINSYEEGKGQSRVRYAAIRNEVMAAAKDGKGHGWEEDHFAEIDSQFGYKR